MSRDEIKVPKQAIFATIVLLVILTAFILASKEFEFSTELQAEETPNDASTMAAGSAEKFSLLSGQGEERSVVST